MSVEKKSLISNRKATKKANVVKAKPEATKIPTARLYHPTKVVVRLYNPSRIKT